VPAGEYLLNEFTMFSLGVPLSKNYFATITSLGSERLFRMSKTESAFTALPVSEQSRIFVERSSLAFCLIACKVDGCANGLEQLQLGFGMTDEKAWKDRYEKVFLKQEVKKLGFLESCSDSQVSYLKDFFSSLFDALSK